MKSRMYRICLPESEDVAVFVIATGVLDALAKFGKLLKGTDKPDSLPVDLSGDDARVCGIKVKVTTF